MTEESLFAAALEKATPAERLAFLEQACGADAARLQRLQRLLAAPYFVMEYIKGEPLLLTGYEGMKQREAKIPPQGQARLTEALERLVQLYEATGQKDKAEEWRKKVQAAKAPPKPAAKP